VTTIVRTRRACALAAVAALAAACQDKLPAAPDQLTTGIVIYEHANYAGGSAHIDRDVSDLQDYKGPCKHESGCPGEYCSTTYDWNDCISSIKVAPGWRATVFVDTGFHHDWLDVTADVPDFGQVRGYCHDDTWNDCISSIRVRQQ
jgi:hypothetical protein